ncbi:MAG: hypothetical protein KBC53_03945 [Nitrosomonas sp.]|nr:hypothetical protein [Nitrosomonas sp.]
MTTKTQRELNLEYWGRVHDMCDAYNKQHGTNIKPQQCVKHCGDICNFKNAHPMFDGQKYDLAVAIIEDTPVFVWDKIYHKAQKHCVPILEGAFYHPSYWTLTPPKEKRTFNLNGKQLPCPSEDYDESVLELLGEHYYFESIEDRNEVAREIIKLLDNAEDKD